MSQIQVVLRDYVRLPKLVCEDSFALSELPPRMADVLMDLAVSRGNSEAAVMPGMLEVVSSHCTV